MSISTKKLKKQYIVQRTLGRGTFGTVYLTKREGANKLFAVKEALQNAHHKNREANLAQILKHPNIVKIYHIFFTEKDDGMYLNIVMEYFPATLYDVIHQFQISKKQMPESHIKFYALQMFRACHYLSCHNICHRDIKPQNILINQRTLQLCICDFGSAKILKDNEWNKHYICSRFYRAPELLCQSNNYLTSIDNWSLGCVIAEMYLGKPLFAGYDTNDQLNLITDILGPLPPGYPENMTPFEPIKVEKWVEILSGSYNVPSKKAGDLISKLITYDFNNRLHFVDVIDHPFVSSIIYDHVQEKSNYKYPPLLWTDEEIELIKKYYPNLVE